MRLLGNRVLVSKIEDLVKEGFTTVEVQDSFVYKGKVEVSPFPEGDMPFRVGDIILFAKYSPDTQEVDYKGTKMKIVRVEDVLAVL